MELFLYKLLLSFLCCIEPDVVAFLKSRKTQKTSSAVKSSSPAAGPEMMAEEPGVIRGDTSPSVAMRTDTPPGLSGEPEGASRDDPGVFKASGERKDPEGMLERDSKKETGDVTSKPETERTEARFTFNGLVIPRSATTVPSRLCLHHHENEAQVSLQ